MSIQYKMIAATDVGCHRSLNEDCVRIIPDFNVAIVADGMGGHKAGEIASRMAVSTISEYFEEQVLIHQDSGKIQLRKVIAESIVTANTEVYSNGRKMSHMEGMGTTLVVGCYSGNQLYLGHIGDSRCYCFKNGKLKQLTDDHTLANDILKENPNSEAPSYSHHVLKKALGIESFCEPDIFSVEVDSKDIYLFCSDGLTGVIEDSDIEQILALRSDDLESCMNALITTSLEGGAPDNVSIILVTAN